ncbi:MAG: sel1 repeat family protein [Clostridia bacterium]|nr:sel1 repeat family protein [Clostridia bacterium]
MTIDTVAERISGFAAEVDVARYPELCSYFERVCNDEFWEHDAYGVACVIYNCDRQEVLPECVAGLLCDIYTDELAEENHDAICDFGSLYYTGRIGEQNYEKAVYYYKLAAALGNRQAQENLGYCYYYGRGCKVDYAKAFHYFVKGALDGHLISLYKIGDMYKNGYYVEKDEQEAFCIYSHCLEGLDDSNTTILGADVHIRMADCYFYATGTEQDLAAALRHYQAAERLYWVRLGEGDFLIRKQFERSIAMQDTVRTEMRKSLPGFGWVTE